MDKLSNYNPENTEFGTKHDGELILPNDIIFEINTIIQEHIKLIEKINFRNKGVPLNNFQIEDITNHWMKKAKQVYTELIAISDDNSEDYEVNKEIMLLKFQEDINGNNPIFPSYSHDSFLRSILGINNKE